MRDRVAELDEQAAEPEFWTDLERSKVVLKEKARLEKRITSFQKLSGELEDASTLAELAKEVDDEESMNESLGLFHGLAPRVRQFELQQTLGEEADSSDAILEINSGAGGTDASDWAEMLKRMYLYWADKMGFKSAVIDEQAHEEAGIKSCTLEISGEYAYGYLKAEIGVHRLVRISPFDSSARRHTAFASVHAFPAVDDDIEVEIVDSELRIDTYRASGAGGQHINTTDSAVRITHLPTNIVVTCQNERSQHKNKARALKMLKAKLYQHEMQQRQAEKDATNAEKKRIEWGSQIRSYVLHPYRMVKDLRTGVEMGDTDKVLNGELLGFMEAWLVQRSNE
jgi:peptide chain release factor 2